MSLGFPRQTFIILGPFASPGVATIRGAGSPRKWNVPDAFGFSWPAIRYMGAIPSRFEVDIDLWLPEHFISWDVFSTILARPTPGVGPAALSATGALGIRHPVLNAPPLNITMVVVEDVSQAVQNDTGLWTYTIKFCEWRKGLPALARPIAAIPAAPPVAQAPPNEREKVMLELTSSATSKEGILKGL